MYKYSINRLPLSLHVQNCIVHQHNARSCNTLHWRIEGGAKGALAPPPKID